MSQPAVPPPVLLPDPGTEGPAAPLHVRPVRHWQAGGFTDGCDRLVDEVPVALVYNGVSHAVMLASPTDLDDFALGFSLTEGIAERPSQVYGVEAVEAAPHGIELRIALAAGRMAALAARRRTLAGRTGCGLCGLDSLAQALPAVPRVAQGAGRLTPAVLDTAVARLAGCQTLHGATGAAHAAAFADQATGAIVLAREDVGRHNALDKLAGAMARRGVEPQAGFIVVTSRASHEMVQKAAMTGVPILAALAAPTALAVRTAEAAGLTLVGFAGRARRVVYAHAARLAVDAKADAPATAGIPAGQAAGAPPVAADLLPS